MARAASFREATVPAFAKLNLSLHVLGRRPDGYHELRTVFQTIALADSLHLRYAPGGPLRISLDDPLHIPNNLVMRAAELVAEEVHLRGSLEMRLTKRIPLGGGLGGGSTDAAAVLLALPALAGKPVPASTLARLALQLGSDVPFFLHGGTALGLGRGEELYPLATPPAPHVLLLTPGLHVSTPDAFRALSRPLLAELTFTELIPTLETFRLLVTSLSVRHAGAGWRGFCENDFEEAVFGQHPRLAALRRKLRRGGAEPARMSGSGSTLYGVFPNAGLLRAARTLLAGVASIGTRFLNQAQYRASWYRALAGIADTTQWPPLSLSASNASSPRKNRMSPSKIR